jgi:peptidoglycan/LPS O-acetylase OafA/YrhL
MIEHPTLTYRSDIQGLRAIAILLVVLAHANIPLFSGGFVGVDIFFVLSGYLITGLLLKEYAENGRIRLAAFYARRLKRLLPALLAMICLTAVVGLLLLSSYEFKEQSRSIYYAAWWTSNLFFSFSELNYFAELQTKDLFLHTWSLGVEEQYYLVWPLLLIAALTILARRHRQSDRSTRLLFVLGTLFLASLGLSLYWSETRPLWSFYLMPSRIWQFALGGAVFIWLRRHIRDNGTATAARNYPKWAATAGTFGLILIVGSAVLLHSNITYPGYWALFPSLGTALVLAAGQVSTEKGTANLLAHPWLVWIGDRSYSWYLWHWPVLMLAFTLGINGRLETALLAAFSLLLAMFSYRYVELPFWKGRFSRLKPSRIILLSILAMLMVINGSFYSLSNLKPPPPSFSISATRSDIPEIYRYRCDDWFSSAKVRPCVFGDPKAQRTIVLIGDSVGAQWFSLVREIFPAPQWRLVVLTKSSCAIVDEDYFYDRIGGIYKVCTDWRNKVLDLLPSLTPDVVLIGSAANYGFTQSQWTEGTARVLARITAVTKYTLVIPGTPALGFDGPGCLERHIASAKPAEMDQNEPVCSQRLKNPQPANVSRYLGEATQRFSNAVLLDLNDLVCPDGRCSARSKDSGIVVFRDKNHLTDTFVRAQIPEVISRLKRSGLEPLLQDSPP